MAKIVVRPFDLVTLGDRVALPEFVGHGGREAGLRFGQDDAILWPLRSGERGCDLAEVERKRIGIDGIGAHAGAIGALRFGVGLDQSKPRRLAAGGFQISERLGVDREQTAGRPIFGRHIGDRGPIGDGHRIEARAVELDEFSDDPFLAQHLSHGQNEIGGRHPLPQFALELEADHLGQQHRQRLAEHGGFGLDAPDSPAENGEAIDHGRMAIGADQRVGEGDFDRLTVALLFRRPDGLGEIFEVDLVANAGAGRHDAKVGEPLLAPFQEPITLLVLFVLAGHVLAERFAGAEIVDHDRMVDDKIDRNKRIDLIRIAVQRDHGVAHCGEIDHRRHAREVLHQHARRAEGDLVLFFAAIVDPRRDRLDVFLLDGAPIFVAQKVLKHDFERERQLGDAGEPVLFRGL